MGKYYDLRNAEDVKAFRQFGHDKCENIVTSKAAKLSAKVILE